ncbi:uncharacterized protein LOC103573685 isoform X3 [Microplitis demolitor]|nr:uncharacterized protein LOC103573685 isoform X3 [Microplitis demolitor]
MNSPLEPDFDGFDFPEKNNKIDTTEENKTGLPIIEEQLNIVKSLECVSEELPQCEVCSQQFLTKKELRSHITLHLGQPRIVLKRCSNLHLVKKKEKDKYCLSQEKKGSLKLTLKKQNHRDFAVISRDLDFDSDNSHSEEVAGEEQKHHQDEEEEELEEHEDTLDDDNEEQTDQVPHEFENVIVNEDDNYQDDNYDNNEEDNFLEDNEERPSVETNEGDSGVGSDMANTCEKDDQNVDNDDLHNVDNYHHEDDDRNNVEESEDTEEPDPIDATYRETIENLKKIGEQTSTIREDMSPRDEDDSPDESSSDVITSRINDNDALKLLSNNSAIELYPAKKSSEKSSKNNNNDGSRLNSSINWSQIENLTSSKDDDNTDDNVNKDNDQTGKDNTDNSTEAGLLLQNLLTEHNHRKNSEERSSHTSSSHNSSVDTEYVSLERLAETVSKCRVCGEKFTDITMLDDHRLKAGHYQCNVPGCSSLVFSTSVELSLHKSQSHEVHNNPLSPSISIIPSQVSQLSPRITDSAPNLGHNSPSLTNHRSPHNISPHTNSPHNLSPHPMTLDPLNPLQINRTSPLTSSHQTHSPSYPSQQHHHHHQQQEHHHHQQQPQHQHQQQQIIPPINFDQLPPPVQQLAQQVQRMALPQPQMPPSLPPGANTMIPGANYFVPPAGRPPMYHRMPSSHQPGPQMHQYPPHLAHLYGSQYGPPYSQYPGPSQMHPQLQQQLQQQMPRGRYPPSMMPNPRGPRPPPVPAQVPRQRLKRPLPPQAPPQQVQQQQQQQQQQRASEPSSSKQRRMDLLIPDRNEDADCHVIAQQKRNDGVPIIQNVQGATQSGSRNDSTIHLTDSITLSVRQPGSTPAQVQSPGTAPPKKPDAKAVANVLAARGITVTPTANKNKSGEQQKQQPSTQQQQPPQQRATAATSPSVTALNLNSAISIIPTSSQRKQQQQQQQQQQQDQQFAVPQNKQSKQTTQDIERPPRPPTIDLTQESSSLLPPARRGRPTRAALTCQICDKSFQSQEVLIQHMASHRTTNKLDYKCNLCSAAYPTSQGLVLHKQSYHKELDSALPNGGTELAIPVVDLKSPQTLSRLNSLGIQSYIPLSQLSAQTGGYFALPIVTIDSPRNPNSCNLGALGATSILSLGPLKHLSNR